MKPILRNIQNNDAYSYDGENNFTNLRTGKSGSIDDETARKVLRFNIEATEIINEYPIIEKMINILNLKLYSDKK